MHEGHAVELHALLWAAGWLVAVLVLFAAGCGCRSPRASEPSPARLYAAACVVAGLGVWVLANVALHLNDTHIDLTREKVYTPSATAMAVVDELQDAGPHHLFLPLRGSRSGSAPRNILEVMGRRNPLLTVLTVDPDKQPELARREGVRLYNAAIIEAAGRRVLIQGTDEAEIAIGIQRVLRTRSLTVCFLEGHGEFPMDGFEFHTHLEGVADHSHGEASSHVIETAGHGVGRLRRVAGSAGLRHPQARAGDRPVRCPPIARCSSRPTRAPRSCRRKARRCGPISQAAATPCCCSISASCRRPGLSRLLSDLGVRLEQQVVVDPLSHYHRDAEMVAVTGYDPHPDHPHPVADLFPRHPAADA